MFGVMTMTTRTIRIGGRKAKQGLYRASYAGNRIFTNRALVDFLFSLGITPHQTPLVFTLPNVAFDYGHAVIVSVELGDYPDGSLPL